jgi:hypothetical protein
VNDERLDRFLAKKKEVDRRDMHGIEVSWKSYANYFEKL